ncbi:MAG: GumC family protein [bacterium]
MKARAPLHDAMKLKATNSAFSIQQIAIMLYPRKWLALALFLAVFATVAFVTMTMPDIYKASAKLLFKKERADKMISASESTFSTKPDVKEETLNSEIEIIKSAPLLRAVVQNIGLEKKLLAANPQLSEADAVQIATIKLNKGLNIKPIPVSSIIQISYESEKPLLAAEVVNELCRRYVDKNLEINESSSIYDFFRREAEALQDSLQIFKVMLADFGSANNLVDPAKQRELLLQQLAEYEKELELSRASKRETSEQVEFLEKQLAEEPQLVQSQTRRVHNTVLITMQQELDSLKTKYDELAKIDVNATSEEAAQLARNVTRSIKSRIAQVEEALLNEQSATPQEIAVDVNKTIEKLSDNLRRTQFELIGYQAQEEALAELVAKVKRQSRQVEQNSLTYEALKKKYELTQSNYMLYLKKQEEARISEALDREKVSNVTIVDPATVPLSPIRPNKKLNLILGFLLAIMVAVGMPFGLAYFDNRIRTDSDIERKLDIPVIGSFSNEEWLSGLLEKGPGGEMQNSDIFSKN